MSASISYEVDYLRILADQEERHFWFRSRRRIIVDALRRWFPDAQSYLEIGSGTGYIARAIAEASPKLRVVASDALVENDSCLRIDARSIPFTSEFDVLGAYDVLEHIEDDRAALNQFRASCRPGGGILLTVPQHAWLWSPADTYARHHRRYRKEELLSELRECDFEVLGCTSFHTLNLPLFFLRSRFLRATGRDPQASIPVAPVNWLLEQSMELDRMLIRAGVQLPFGVSLMVAARRKD
jgi:SAM-dependent methyltransferase